GRVAARVLDRQRHAGDVVVLEVAVQVRLQGQQAGGRRCLEPAGEGVPRVTVDQLVAADLADRLRRGQAAGARLADEGRAEGLNRVRLGQRARRPELEDQVVPGDGGEVVDVLGGDRHSGRAARDLVMESTAGA